MDLIAAVRVDRELRLRGRAGGGEDERGLVRLHRHPLAGRPIGACDEIVPCDVPTGIQRGSGAAPLEHDDVLDEIAQ